MVGRRGKVAKTVASVVEEELESLRSENRRLTLEQKLKLLQSLSESPSLLLDSPPDVNPFTNNS